MLNRLRSKKGEAIFAAMAVGAIIVVQFAITVMDGTFAKQVDKIKAAHNAPITVDK